jgi:hypothetical protein
MGTFDHRLQSNFDFVFVAKPAETRIFHSRGARLDRRAS